MLKHYWLFLCNLYSNCAACRRYQSVGKVHPAKLAGPHGTHQSLLSSHGGEEGIRCQIYSLGAAMSHSCMGAKLCHGSWQQDLYWYPATIRLLMNKHKCICMCYTQITCKSGCACKSYNSGRKTAWYLNSYCQVHEQVHEQLHCCLSFWPEGLLTHGTIAAGRSHYQPGLGCCA